MSKIAQQLESLRQKDVKALRQELKEAQAQLQKSRVDLAFGHANKPSELRSTRKQIARLQTILQEKEHSND